MSDDECRKIEELIVRYELEPKIRDVYVEGSSDKSLIDWFLKEMGIDGVVVYEISTVEIDAEKVAEHGEENNNRGRVITLAYEMESMFGNEALQITCIADNDFDLILNKKYDCGLILFTDYSCLEMYLFKENCMDKYFKLCLQGFSVNVNEIMDCLSKVLQEVFLIRLANKVLGLNMTWITFDRCCSVSDKGIILDVDDYITRYLNSNGWPVKKKEFFAVIEDWRPRLRNDCRCQMNGHDFMELLAWFISKHGIDRRLYDTEVVCRSLYGCIEIEDLKSEMLFKNLVSRVRVNGS